MIYVAKDQFLCKVCGRYAVRRMAWRCWMCRKLNRGTPEQKATAFENRIRIRRCRACGRVFQYPQSECHRYCSNPRCLERRRKERNEKIRKEKAKKRRQHRAEIAHARALSRAWKLAHPEKVAQYHAKYQAKHPYIPIGTTPREPWW